MQRIATLALHIMPAAAAPVQTCAVTGAAGYVGSWIVKTLLARSHIVRACVRDVDAEKVQFLKAMPEYATGALTLHSADMSVSGAYDSIFVGCDVVFHAAEVFMIFAPGRDLTEAVANFGGGQKVNMPDLEALNQYAMKANQYIVDAINKSGSVSKLIYTSSILAMVDGCIQFYRDPTHGHYDHFSSRVSRRLSRNADSASLTVLILLPHSNTLIRSILDLNLDVL